MIDKIKSSIDWFISKGTGKQIVILLILIISYLGWQYHKAQINLENELVNLREVVENQEKLIYKLESDLQRAKYDNILAKSNDDLNPVPMWMVEIKTGKVLWCNKAYERKYLIPKFTNREEFIGTDGTYVYGEENVELFKKNNLDVFQKQRPITFRDEVNAIITKFPVNIGDYTYAIGGIEYVNFD